MVILCQISPELATSSQALHEHVVSAAFERLNTFASLALSTSASTFSSFRTMDSRRKGLRVSFAFCQKSYLPDGRVKETVATVEKLSDLWKPVAMDRVPPFVMNCSCN